MLSLLALRALVAEAGLCEDLGAGMAGGGAVVGGIGIGGAGHGSGED